MEGASWILTTLAMNSARAALVLGSERMGLLKGVSRKGEADSTVERQRSGPERGRTSKEAEDLHTPCTVHLLDMWEP